MTENTLTMTNDDYSYLSKILISEGQKRFAEYALTILQNDSLTDDKKIAAFKDCCTAILKDKKNEKFLIVNKANFYKRLADILKDLVNIINKRNRVENVKTTTTNPISHVTEKLKEMGIDAVQEDDMIVITPHKGN